ncbi:MerR family transcriptional regulator [candidate division KSB1 bacterium]
MNVKPIKKLYFSISEVSEMTGLKPYVLRYWETEFVELRPAKNRAGNRIYKEKDIQLINKIKELLYSRKYTIEGARNFLRQETESVKNGKKEQAPDRDMSVLIDAIQSELESILHLLNGKT